MAVGMSADLTSSENGVGTRLIRVKTRPLLPPRDDLYDTLDLALPRLLDGDVIAIASKVVAIHQGRCVPVTSVQDKEELVEAEAEASDPLGAIASPPALWHNAAVSIASLRLRSESGGGWRPTGPGAQAKCHLSPIVFTRFRTMSWPPSITATSKGGPMACRWSRP